MEKWNTSAGPYPLGVGVRGERGIRKYRSIDKSKDKFTESESGDCILRLIILRPLSHMIVRKICFPI